MIASDLPLIPRAALFGNPERVNALLSPDGKYLSWRAPRDGVMNIYVAPASDPSASRAVTAETLRPIRGYLWAPDSSAILFVNDQGGDEDHKLYAVDIASGAQRLLTPFDRTTVTIVARSCRVKDRILIGLNNRDARWHDVYSLDIASGTLTLVLKNDGFGGFEGGFFADQDLKLRIAAKPREDGGFDYYRIDDDRVAAAPFLSVGFDDAMTTVPYGFTADGKTLYWMESRGRDKTALVAEDRASGARVVLAEDALADIGGVFFEPQSNVIKAYQVNYLRDEWIALDPQIGADLNFLKTEVKGDFQIASVTDANDAWIVAVDPVTAPAVTYRYDRATKTLTKLFVHIPALEGAPLADMFPLEIKSRDGLTLVSYLTLPKGSDQTGRGRPDAPLPMVLLVHGGPWGRDVFGYNGLHQWLANRGYAVLSVNFRASTGFGKAFLAAGDLEWGAKMHDDLLDAVAYAVAMGIALTDKVAIMGTSYGGYAALAGLAFTPERFACGVDVVGPSNLNTLLDTIPAYWASIRPIFYKRIGDPTTEAGRRLLHDHSPLTRADQIRRPLLIGQGANDPRVKQAEADQIVDAMARKDIPVTYVLFPDEGHGFARPENRIAFYAITEQFLAVCLGGRAEPIADAIKDSSARVMHGAAFAPGLVEALA